MVRSCCRKRSTQDFPALSLFSRSWALLSLRWPRPALLRPRERFRIPSRTTSVSGNAGRSTHSSILQQRALIADGTRWLLEEFQLHRGIRSPLNSKEIVWAIKTDHVQPAAGRVVGEEEAVHESHFLLCRCPALGLFFALKLGTFQTEDAIHHSQNLKSATYCFWKVGFDMKADFS